MPGVPNPDFESWLREEISSHGEDLAVIKALTASTNEVVKEHSQKIDALEAHNDKQSGIIRAVVWVGSILWAILTFMLGGHIYHNSGR